MLGFPLFFFETKYLWSKPFLKLINKFFLELLLLLLKFNSKLFSSFPDAVTKPTLAKLFSYVLYDLLHLCRVCWMKPMTRRCEMKSERWQGISELSSYQLSSYCFSLSCDGVNNQVWVKKRWPEDQIISMDVPLLWFVCAVFYSLFNTLAKCDNSQGNVGRSEF